ncbi:MAG: DNA lyase [Candidatus Buchananbacteria bacterium]|nr:DNA lyase [Candidatus Buchananbacteria bacterium]
MRLWSLHPQYLDVKGLTALWREGLLAKHVLEGKTKGYTRHPQLERFRAATDPLKAINCYLTAVYDESCRRGYCYDPTKIDRQASHELLTVTQGQLDYEFKHLLSKLETRDPQRFQELQKRSDIQSHPLFTVVSGPIADWERPSNLT